jgi:hypothetical protein
MSTVAERERKRERETERERERERERETKLNSAVKVLQGHWHSMMQ